MKKSIATAAAFLLIASSAAFASNMVMVGGKEMSPEKNIIANAVKSADHTTLVAAVKAAGLVKTLEGAGPFTVFAPTNEAFNKLPEGTVATLLKPENKAKLTAILTYHVVAGKLTFNKLAEKIKADGGSATLKTVNGKDLTVMMNGPHNIVIKDEKGNVATISTYDVIQSNGVIQVVDSVLMP